MIKILAVCFLGFTVLSANRIPSSQNIAMGDSLRFTLMDERSVGDFKYIVKSFENVEKITFPSILTLKISPAWQYEPEWTISIVRNGETISTLSFKTIKVDVSPFKSLAKHGDKIVVEIKKVTEIFSKKIRVREVNKTIIYQIPQRLPKIEVQYEISLEVDGRIIKSGDKVSVSDLNKGKKFTIHTLTNSSEPKFMIRLWITRHIHSYFEITGNTFSLSLDSEFLDKINKFFPNGGASRLGIEILNSESVSPELTKIRKGGFSLED